MTNVDFAGVEFAFAPVNHFFFRDPLNSVEAGDLMTVPLPGQPRHGVTSSMYTTMAAAPAAYDRHLGLTTSWRRS
jgi:hypothetical protein